MLKLLRQKLSTVAPPVWLIVVLYVIMGMIVLPLGVLLLAWAIGLLLKGFYPPVDPNENIHWVLRTTGNILIGYTVIMLGLLIVDNSFGKPWRLLEWRTTIWWIWIDPEEGIYPAMKDAMAVQAVGVFSAIIARWFGSTDEDGVWHKPEWLIRKQQRMKNGERIDGCSDCGARPASDPDR